MKIAAAAGALRNRKGKVRVHGFQMRVNFQGLAEAYRRLVKLAERHMAKPLTRKSAKVIGITRYGLSAVRDGLRKVFYHVAHGCALVPTLGKVRGKLNYAREKILSFLKFASLHRFDAGSQ